MTKNCISISLIEIDKKKFFKHKMFVEHCSIIQSTFEKQTRANQHGNGCQLKTHAQTTFNQSTRQTINLTMDSVYPNHRQ